MSPARPKPCAPSSSAAALSRETIFWVLLAEDDEDLEEEAEGVGDMAGLLSCDWPSGRWEE